MEQHILLPTFSNYFEVEKTEKASKTNTTSVVKNMRFAFWLNFVFACIEFTGGILTNSVTILSDAVHDLGDSIAIGLSLILEKKSLEGKSSKYTYGKRRLSVFSAFITSLVLILGSIFIVKEAVYRFAHIEKVNATGVFWLAILGIVFNGFAVLKLKNGSKESLNQRGIMLHLLEDVLGWFAVLIGAIVMYYTSWFWIDPILSLAIAGLILWNAVKNIKQSIRIFLQATPDDFDEEMLKKDLKNIEEIKEIRNINCWTIDGESHVLTMTLIVSSTISLPEIIYIKKQVLEIIKPYKISESTIEFG